MICRFGSEMVKNHSAKKNNFFLGLSNSLLMGQGPQQHPISFFRKYDV